MKQVQKLKKMTPKILARLSKSTSNTGKVSLELLKETAVNRAQKRRVAKLSKK